MWSSSNQDYWIPKIEGNVRRDEKNKQLLQGLGWKVVTVWECELKKAVFDDTMAQVEAEIKNSNTKDEKTSLSVC